MAMPRSTENISLRSLGYTSVGLDDGWQKCGAGVFGGFHNSDGYPIVDKTKFPNLRKMTDIARSLGLRPSWYANNCYCKELSCEYQPPPCWEGAENITKHYLGDVQALVDFGFEGVKLDGCGQFRNLSRWAALLNASGRPFEIENCHGPPFPTWPNDTSTPSFNDGPCIGNKSPSECPYSMYRSSSDISADFPTVYSNLLSTIRFQGSVPLSRPGAWAHPDMLEVGMLPNYEEDRTHFGAWAVTSSPLILGFDLNNDDIMNRAWSIISNPEVIAINQDWNGHPGTRLKMWTVGNGINIDLWGKPLKGGKVAALVFSPDARKVPSLTSFSLNDVPENWFQGSCASVRDVWARKRLPGNVNGKGTPISVNLTSFPRTSQFFILTPCS